MKVENPPKIKTTILSEKLGHWILVFGWAYSNENVDIRHSAHDAL